MMRMIVYLVLKVRISFFTALLRLDPFIWNLLLGSGLV